MVHPIRSTASSMSVMKRENSWGRLSGRVQGGTESGAGEGQKAGAEEGVAHCQLEAESGRGSCLRQPKGHIEGGQESRGASPFGLTD